MSRRRSHLAASLTVVALVCAAQAHAQTARQGDNQGEERLRRLDASALAGGEGGLAGGDYGVGQPRPAPLAGGDYGVIAQPDQTGVRPAAPTILDDPFANAPRAFRRFGLRTAGAPPPLSAEDDAYSATGVRAGAFVLRPSIETAAGYDDNPDRLPKGGKGSRYSRVRAELDGESDWSRHAIGLRSSAQFRRDFDVKGAGYEPLIDAAVTGRVDISERTQINTELRGAIAASRPGDPETPTGIDGEELTRSVGATLGIAQRFNRFSLRLEGLADRYTVDDSKLKAGGKINNSDRAYNGYQARLRGAYELSPSLAPFAEVTLDTRDYDKKVANFDPGRKLGSDGYALRTGAQFELTRLVTGEIAVGYGRQTPKDGDLKTVEGWLIDGAVAWAPTALTTVNLSARSSLDESTLGNTGGVLSRAFEANVQHRLRRNLLVTGRFAFERADYKGAKRVDDAATIGLDAEYQLNRNVALTGTVERIRLKSSIPGEDYTANVVEFGLRFRR